MDTIKTKLEVIDSHELTTAVQLEFNFEDKDITEVLEAYESDAGDREDNN